MRLVKTIDHLSVNASLWLGDALAFLGSLPNDSVDLMVTSPPYFMGKEYDRSRSLRDFRGELARVAPEIVRVIRPGGSLCWQVGNHVHRGEITPLDTVIIELLSGETELALRNRIIWTFGHGTHATMRFSGRYECVLWYTKGSKYHFNLDAVRLPQRYPGKRHYKGPKKGLWSGNPLGKNPGDVWDIPNVKARHVEKTGHPCQYPVALASRLVRALCPSEGLVMDPYMGSGTTGVAALMHQCNFTGIDLEERYLNIAAERLMQFIAGEGKIRNDKPVREPKVGEAVSRLPEHFRSAREAVG
jgi:adenine-specific DNA-methyltransferase